MYFVFVYVSVFMNLHNGVSNNPCPISCWNLYEEIRQGIWDILYVCTKETCKSTRHYQALNQITHVLDAWPFDV